MYKEIVKELSRIIKSHIEVIDAAQDEPQVSKTYLEGRMSEAYSMASDIADYLSTIKDKIDPSFDYDQFMYACDLI